MKQTILKAAGGVAFAAALSITATAANIDPILLALAAPDSRTLAGVQVAQAQATPIGQALMGQLQFDQSTNRALAAAGFDPRRDLREVLLTANSSAAANGLGGLTLLGRGAFHPEKIVAAAAAAGATSAAYHGVALIEAKSGQGGGTALSGALAFLDASTMLAGDTVSVKAAIDRRAAHASFSGALADSARQVAASNDVWLVTQAPPASASAALSSQLGPFGNILQAAVQLSAGLKLAADRVTLSADMVMRSPQDAQSMADVLKFAIQMAQSNAAQGQQGPVDPALADGAQISASGATMHLVLAVPEKQLEQLFLPSPAPKKLAAR
jgi:hypothetical protein